MLSPQQQKLARHNSVLKLQSVKINAGGCVLTRGCPAVPTNDMAAGGHICIDQIGHALTIDIVNPDADHAGLGQGIADGRAGIRQVGVIINGKFGWYRCSCLRSISDTHSFQLRGGR